MEYYSFLLEFAIGCIVGALLSSLTLAPPTECTNEPQETNTKIDISRIMLNFLPKRVVGSNHLIQVMIGFYSTVFLYMLHPVRWSHFQERGTTTCLYYIIGGPFLEELIFREALWLKFQALFSSFSPHSVSPRTVVCTSLLFVFMHVEHWTNPIVLCELFVFALVLGGMRKNRDGWGLGFALHALRNLAALNTHG